MGGRKKVGPRMETWETPVLIRYCWEDVPSRATQRRLLLRKDEIQSKIWPETPACQTLSKALDVSSATAQVSPNVLQAPEILLDTTFRRSTSGLEDLKPYWKSGRLHFSERLISLLFTSFQRIY